MKVIVPAATSIVVVKSDTEPGGPMYVHCYHIINIIISHMTLCVFTTCDP